MKAFSDKPSYETHPALSKLKQKLWYTIEHVDRAGNMKRHRQHTTPFGALVFSRKLREDGGGNVDVYRMTHIQSLSTLEVEQ